MRTAIFLGLTFIAYSINPEAINIICNDTPFLLTIIPTIILGMDILEVVVYFMDRKK
jgi:hypothetical protein